MTKRKTIPKADLIWEQLFIGNRVFLITADISRVKYTLWEKVSDGYLLYGTAKTPPDLKSKFEKEMQE
mgnify:CR=1 FL=1